MLCAKSDRLELLHDLKHVRLYITQIKAVSFVALGMSHIAKKGYYDKGLLVLSFYNIVNVHSCLAWLHAECWHQSHLKVIFCSLCYMEDQYENPL